MRLCSRHTVSSDVSLWGRVCVSPVWVAPLVWVAPSVCRAPSVWAPSVWVGLLWAPPLLCSDPCHVGMHRGMAHALALAPTVFCLFSSRTGGCGRVREARIRTPRVREAVLRAPPVLRCVWLLALAPLPTSRAPAAWSGPGRALAIGVKTDLGGLDVWPCGIQ